MELTAILSRIQAGVTIGYHFIFPSLTLGLVFYLFIVEAMYFGSGKEIYKQISTFVTKVLALVFAFGVATGIIIPFTFGTNWAEFSRFAGPLFGTNLAVEGLVAFTMEAIFLGLLLFGRDKVSKGMYLFSALMVFVGSHLSGLVIIATDSWMQTPFATQAALSEFVRAGTIDPAINGWTIVGATPAVTADGIKYLQGGHIVLTDFFKAFFNPSTWIRFAHTITAAWLCGAMAVLGMGAWFLLKKKDTEAAKKMMGVAAVLAVVTAVAQPLWGHTSVMQVIEWQGPKAAAMEGQWYSTEQGEGAPLFGFGIVDTANKKTYGFEIPYGMSFFEDPFNPTKGVEGLYNKDENGKDVLNPAMNMSSEAEIPPAAGIFQTFRLMVLIGSWLIIVSLVALWWSRKNTLDQRNWFLHVLIWSAPLPILANEFGWITAEVGRQPWIIWKVLPTNKAISAVPPEYVIFSLVMLTLVYVALTFLFFRFFPGIVRHGITEKAV